MPLTLQSKDTSQEVIVEKKTIVKQIVLKFSEYNC